MQQLLRSIASLGKGSIGSRIRSRMREFRELGQQGEDEIFKELCFCLLTANFSAEGGIRVQQAVGDGFITLPQAALARRLKSSGYRFPNARARYIVEARRHHGSLKQALCRAGPQQARAWLANNVLGLGYKESSHFLRNIGFEGLAIIDFHIIDLLARHGIIEKPPSRSLSAARYLEIERTLADIASAAGISQGELDLYLWYMETGKILK
jgi:N-glycosylase/DNA lyase